MPYIATEPVESSNIERIGYHRKQMILRIVFQGGRAYDYPMVTERDFRDLMAADSKGSFFNRRIKPLYAHRNPREVELVEPCCEHEGSDTCTKECFPCNEFCCSSTTPGASQEEIAAAIKGGLAFGAADHSAAPVEDAEVRPSTDGEKAVAFAMAYGATPEMVASLRAGGQVAVDGKVVVGGEDVGVPPAVPLTESGEIDVGAIPDATALFVDGVQISDNAVVSRPPEEQPDEPAEEPADSNPPGGYAGPAEQAGDTDEKEEETNGNSD